MRFDKERPPPAQQVNHPRRGKQRGLPILLICFALAACGAGDAVEDTFLGGKDFAGMVAADEPQAALIGRDILTGGGSAADAAVAMAFVMTVTLPSQVGFGSSGACLAFDRGQKMVDSVVFAPKAAPDAKALLPAMPRGLFLLHAKYGHIRWNEVISPAESFAQRGVPASRAFVRQLAPVASSLFADERARQLFGHTDGTPVAEGDTIRNPQLGTAIGRVALHGVGDLYAGPWTREFIAAAAQTGATIDETSMRNFTPVESAPLSITYEHEIALFPPLPAVAGEGESKAWAHLGGEGAYKDADAGSRPQLVTNAAAAAMANKTRAASGGAGLVAVDGSGSAVVCEFTLNGAFGTGHVVPGFGFFLANPDPDPGLALGPMLAFNNNSNELRLAIAASGGMAAPRALLQAASETLLANKPIAEALAAVAAGQDDGARLEAARCGSGRPNLDRCKAATDPRGFGLALSVAAK